MKTNQLNDCIMPFSDCVKDGDIIVNMSDSKEDRNFLFWINFFVCQWFFCRIERTIKVINSCTLEFTGYTPIFKFVIPTFFVWNYTINRWHK